MKCPKCQFDNRDGVNFCEECGTKMEMECPKCGAKIPLGRKFCGECGYDVKEPKEAPSVDYNQPKSYTPKFLADKILATRSSIEGERKLVTVLFADVSNYTSISEKLDPEEVHKIMDGCFKILMDGVHRYEGTVNQFTGDGIMALFGAPVAHEDHAQRACYAALAIQNSLKGYEEQLGEEFGIAFKMRIGLNSGPVVVGSIGDDLRMDYTAIGDTTNLAARMESLADPGSILVTDYTYRLTRDFFNYNPLGKMEVKGKEAAQEAYKLIKAAGVETRIEAAAAKGLTKFVGRRREMEALIEAYEAARSGAGQVVGIVGEAGVGKSRLLIELRNMLPRGEYAYLEGRCIHYGGSMPYLPLLDILRSYLGIKEGEQESVIRQKMEEKILGLDENLKSVIPPFQELLSLKVEDESYLKLEPKQKRERTFEAIRDLLIRGSQERLLVLAIEDLHWIDKTTEELLDYLIGWLPNTPIMLILLYRPEYTHSWGSKSYYSKVGVDQLSAHSSTELVRAIFEQGEVVPELRELILDRTSGNPLFIEELTHSLVENGSIAKKGDQYVLVGKPSDMLVPDTIQGIIASRMDRLEENLKKILQVASVIGREFFFRILQSITDMKEDLKSCLLNLQGLEFIYEKKVFPELEYIFKHALTQEVAYNSVLLKRRKEIHERIGKAMEELFPEKLEEFYEVLAYHYSKSENREKAFEYLKLSGTKATRSNSLWEAFGYYKEAIKVVGQLPETTENKRRQLETIVLVAPPIRVLGYPEDSLEILQQGESLAKHLGDEWALASLCSLIGTYYTFKGGDPLQGREYQENSFKHAQKTQDVELMAPIGVDLFASYIATGEYWKNVDTAPRVVTLIENSHRESDFFGRPAYPYVLCQMHTALGTGMTGNIEEANAIFDKLRSFALTTNHLYSIGVVPLAHSIVCLCHGDGENAAKHLRECIKYFEEAQTSVWLGQCWSWLGYANYLVGKRKDSLKLIEKGLDFQTKLGTSMWFSSHYLYSSVVHLDIGNLSRAKVDAEKALEISARNNDKDYNGRSRIHLGRIMGKADSSLSDEAERHILQGIKTLEQLKIRPQVSVGHLYLGELYADIDRKQEALINMKKAEGMCQEMGMDYWLAKTEEVLETL